MSISYCPIMGRVLLKIIDQFEQEGILLPEKKTNDFCEVIAIGAPDPIYKPEYKVGDRVVIPVGIGRDMKIEGEQYVIVHQHQILMFECQQA